MTIQHTDSHQDDQYGQGYRRKNMSLLRNGLGHTNWIDWAVFYPPPNPTQCRLYRRRFLQVKDPTNSIKVLKEKATKENPENANNEIHTNTK